jgi:restriction system protein
VRFSTIDLVKAGWLLKENGRWSVSPEGLAAYQTFTDPEAFYKAAVHLFNQWKANQAEEIDSPEDETPQETAGKVASVTAEEAEEQAWAEIDKYLRTINPYEFQDIVAALLRAMGYHVSWTAPPGKDGGIDIVAAGDPLATQPPRIKVQVKRQGDAVRVDGLRSFMALLNDTDVGIFVSVGGFTKDAADEARKQERRKVTLLDAEALFKLWIDYYDKLDDQARRLLPLRRIYFLAPES